MNQFHISGVRKSDGVSTREGSYKTLKEATDALNLLGEDSDCLLAEVSKFADTHPETFVRISIVAQSDRSTGEWRRVEGELRERSSGGEATALLG